MKQFLLALFVLSMAARLPATTETTVRPIPSKITAVTVYADRARITRVATNVPLGEPVTFDKLPGWLDEGSVRVSLTPASAGELVDVQVHKTYLARPDDAALRQAEEAVRQIADQLAALDDERAALDAQQRQVDAIRAFSLEKLPKDTAVREVKIEEYTGMVKFIGNSVLEIARSRRELDNKKRDLQPELQARQRKLNDLRQRAQLEQRSIEVTTTGRGQCTLRLTYMLPGATWEPVHELRAANGAGQIGLASFGVVTQTTGEDWEGVALSLSTQRSTDTIRIPELEKLLVGGDRPLPRLLAAQTETFSGANRRFSGQIMLWNSFANSGKRQQEFGDNYRFQQDAQQRNLQRFALLQAQRGTTAHFTALGSATIRSDGRPARLPLGSTQLAAARRIIAAPEVSLNAAQTAELTNAARQPLLPGKVLLFVEGAFLGTTEIEFVGPGESFPVFLGVADQIKLTRALDKKRSSLSWSGRRRRMQVSYEVTVENLADHPITLELADRVPVSETDEVRVLSVRLTPATKPDNQGLVKWEVTLEPKQTREYRVEYLLDYPAELPPSEPKDNAVDAEALPAAKGLYKQIRDLEMKF